MLDKIHLKNFKCYKDWVLQFKPLTLIAGANGAGKSSIIHSLLLLRQSCFDKDTDWKEQVLLNSDLIELDSAEDLFCTDANTPNISVGAEDNGRIIEFTISPKTINDRASCTVTGDLNEAKENWALFRDSFVYLYAERVHPKSKYIKKSSRLDSRLGNKSANNCAFRLSSAINANESIAIPSLKYPDAQDDTILRNVSAWMGYIMGENVDVTAQETEKDKEAKFIYSIESNNGEQKKLSPMNMPFGNSYVLPIILGVLTAPKDSLFIIENPEAHLHPEAQKRIAELLVLAASSGVQVIIETHSDHIINTLRYGIYKGKINPENTVMYYKKSVKDDFVQINCDRNGKFTGERFPDGFFDASLGMLIEMQ